MGKKGHKFTVEQRARMVAGQKAKLPSESERFFSYVDKGDGTGCWQWIGDRMPVGYGRFYFRGRTRMAHIASMIMAGHTYPEGHVTDHICRNYSCVRPDHLRIVPREWNAVHNSNSPLGRNKAKTHCKNGHPFAGENLARILIKNGGFRGAKKVWRQTRVCLACQPGYRAHPMRFYLPEDLDVELPAREAA